MIKVMVLDDKITQIDKIIKNLENDSILDNKYKFEACFLNSEGIKFDKYIAQLRKYLKDFFEKDYKYLLLDMDLCGKKFKSREPLGLIEIDDLIKNNIYFKTLEKKEKFIIFISIYTNDVNTLTQNEKWKPDMYYATCKPDATNSFTVDNCNRKECSLYSEYSNGVKLCTKNCLAVLLKDLENGGTY